MEEEYNLVDVPTEYGKAIKKSDGTLVSDVQLLIEIANEIKKISKKLG